MTIYDDFLQRENRIWPAFSHAMRFTVGQGAERVIIYGIFAETYNNGMEYLETIDIFELGLIVDEYNQRIAGVDATEVNLRLELIAKKYVADVDKIIHDKEIDTKTQQVAADDIEMDSRFDALESDRDAIETLEARLLAKQRDTEARIKTLEAQITLEGINLSLVDVDISEKELQVTKAENKLSGKDIDLARKDIEITRKDIDISSKDVDLSQKDIDIQEKSLQVLKIQLQELETEQRVLGIGIETARIQLQIVEAGLRQLDYRKESAGMDVQSARYEADIARTARIEIEKTDAGIDQTMAAIGLEEQGVKALEADANLAKLEGQKTEINLDYVKTDKEIAGVKVDINQTEARIAQTDEIEASRDANQAQYEGEDAKLALYDARVAELETKKTTVEANTAGSGTILGQESLTHTAELGKLNAGHDLDKVRLEYAKDETLLGYDQSVDREQSRADIATDKLPGEDTLNLAKIEAIERNQSAQGHKWDADVDYIEKIYKADILTTIRHSIGKDV